MTFSFFFAFILYILVDVDVGISANANSAQRRFSKSTQKSEYSACRNTNFIQQWLSLESYTSRNLLLELDQRSIRFCSREKYCKLLLALARIAFVLDLCSRFKDWYAKHIVSSANSSQANNLKSLKSSRDGTVHNCSE